MSLEKKQKAIYNAMMMLDSVGVKVSIPDDKGRGVFIFKGEFWNESSSLAVRLQNNAELHRARQVLARMQSDHTKEQAILQSKINRLQAGE